LNRRLLKVGLCSLTTFLIITSCRNPDLPWRSGQLVAQLYRQYNQQILLAYSDATDELVVDQQNGYARAYFDNYRKQIIFSAQGTLDYMMNGQQFSTATEDITGYVFEVLLNNQYQIGVEVIDITDGTLGKGQFWGTKSRIIDLSSKRSVVVDGLLFNRNMIVDDYFYGFTFDDDDNQFLEIVDLRTMEHRRINTTKNKINFLYQSGDQVYGQSEVSQTTFAFHGLNMTEEKSTYNDKLVLTTDPWYILKDIAPIQSTEHWYIEPGKYGTRFNQVRLLQMKEDRTINESWLQLKRDDVSQILDVSNYGADHVAVYYEAKDQENDQWYTFITVYDLNGHEVSSTEIERIRKGEGRFLYLDYVE